VGSCLRTVISRISDKRGKRTSPRGERGGLGWHAGKKVVLRCRYLAACRGKADLQCTYAFGKNCVKLDFRRMGDGRRVDEYRGNGPLADGGVSCTRSAGFGGPCPVLVEAFASSVRHAIPTGMTIQLFSSSQESAAASTQEIVQRRIAGPA